MRRHQSLNYPNAASGVRRLQQGLKRAGTLQAPPVKGGSQVGTPYSGAQSPSPTNADEEYDNDSVRAEEDSYFGLPAQQQGQYAPQSPMGRSSPWNAPGAGNEWRSPMVGNGQDAASGTGDDVSRALSFMELSQQQQYGNAGGYQQGVYLINCQL